MNPDPDDATAAPDSEPVPLGRLPEGVRPVRYALELQIVPSDERFSGTAEITIELDRPRSSIWLHGRGLSVSEASITPSDPGAQALPARWDVVDPEGVVALRLPRPIGPGQARIRVVYDAPFDRQLEGLYRVDVGGLSYAFTQFEAVWARRAFPCFDEPAFKTPYDVTLVVPGDQTAIGNTALTSEERLADGRKRVRFATTERLPTYLLAWAVGPLDVVEAPPIAPTAVRSRPIPYRGVAVKGRGQHLAFALHEGARIIHALEDYFGIEYPYDKLDLLAVPDFGAGAMENAGAVTFREEALLIDDATASEGQRRYLVTTVAHELAHQWFGDLVTMVWWDDVWLNEAFATWMENRITDTLHPEYRARQEDLASVEGIMRKDGLVSARKIRQPIDGRDDIANAFDWLTYTKGAAMIGMFERWLGPAVFQDGIRRYLTTHRWGNATADDLLAALGQASGRDVSTPFRTFLEQPGVPLIEASVARQGDTTVLELRQSRWLPVGSTGDRDRTWQVPVCVRWGDDQGATHDRCTLLTEATGRIDLGPGPAAWVMPNTDGNGYYRWSMPAADTERLTSAGWSKLSPREQLSFAGSLKAGFESASLTAAEVFAALPSLTRHEDRSIATAPMGVVAFAIEAMADDALRTRLQSFGAALYTAHHRRLGWGPRVPTGSPRVPAGSPRVPAGSPRAGHAEDGETALLRRDVIGFLAFDARDPAVRREAARRGRAWLGFSPSGEPGPAGTPIQTSAVSPELVDVALAVAAQEGGAPVFEALLARLAASEDAVLRERILSGLGHAREQDLSRRALELSLDPRLRVNEVEITLHSQMSERETRPHAWEWFKTHFDALVARMGNDEAASLPRMASVFTDRAHAEEARAFFEPRVGALPGAPRILANTLEGIELSAARAAAHLESTRAYFSRPRP